MTSTLSSQNPSALFRFKRDSEVTDENQLQSSLLESSSISKLTIEPTQPLPSSDVVYSRDSMEPAIDIGTYSRLLLNSTQILMGYLNRSPNDRA